MGVIVYSYQKQMERLLSFVKEISDHGCDFGNDECEKHPNIDFCIACRAKQLLNYEPVNYSQTTFGCLESPERPNRPEGLNPSMGERWF